MLATRWNCSNSVMGRKVRAEYLWLRTKLSWQPKKEMNAEGESLRRNIKQTKRLDAFLGEEDSPLVAPAGSTERIYSACAGGTDGCWPSLST